MPASLCCRTPAPSSRRRPHPDRRAPWRRWRRRGELFARADLPAEARQAAVAALVRHLSAFVADLRLAGRRPGGPGRAEARDKATVAIAGLGREEDMRGLVRHLRRSGQLTPALDPARPALGQSAPVRGGSVGTLRHAGRPVSPASSLRAALAGSRRSMPRPACRRHALPAFRAALDAIAEQGSANEARRGAAVAPHDRARPHHGRRARHGRGRTSSS